MREIKYKAWHPSVKKMFEWEKVLTNSGSRWMFETEGETNRAEWDNSKLIKLEFTGLLDKNKNEIYEGYILKSKPYLFDGTYVIGQVIFSTERSQWLVEEIDETWKETEILFEVLKPGHETEIIGNIYQHPHLLNKEAKVQECDATMPPKDQKPVT